MTLTIVAQNNNTNNNNCGNSKNQHNIQITTAELNTIRTALSVLQSECKERGNSLTVLACQQLQEKITTWTTL